MRVASELAKADIDLSLPSELVNDDVIVIGKKHKMQILTEYEASYGADFPKVSILVKRILCTTLAYCPPSRNTIGL